MNLVLVGKLDDEGFHIMFGNGKWKIAKGSLIVEKGKKSDIPYTLKSNVEK